MDNLETKPNMLIIAADSKKVESIRTFQDYRITFAEDLEAAKALLEDYKYQVIYCEPFAGIPRERGEYLKSHVARFKNKDSKFIFNCEEPILDYVQGNAFYSPGATREFSLRNGLLKEKNCSIATLLTK